MTLLHFSLKLLEILLYYLKILHSHPEADCSWPLGPAVTLKEGMNLFLFPILRECASTIFFNLLQQKLGNVGHLSKHAIRAVRLALMSLRMTFSFTPEVQITKNYCKNTMKIHWCYIGKHIVLT